MTSLALFDFDGTITRKDTMFSYIRYCRGNMVLWLGMMVLSPIFALYALKLIPNWRAKELMLAFFFKGWRREVMEAKGIRFCEEIVPGMLDPKAMKKLQWHLAEKHEVYLVTASADIWTKPFCDKHGLQIIATGLEFKDGKFTGKLSTINCYGQEKVERINKQLKLHEYEKVYAYGDSHGDKPMLALAHMPFFRCFE